MSGGPIWGEGSTLDFKNHPIRTVPIDGVPWFALPDLIEVLGLHDRVAAEVDRPRFPQALRTYAQELPDEELPGEPERVTLLSPTGVWWLTALTDPGRGQALSAWAKRQAIAALPDAGRDNPQVFLTLSPCGRMPPCPWKYSGRRAEWNELRDVNYLSPAWGR